MTHYICAGHIRGDYEMTHDICAGHIRGDYEMTHYICAGHIRGDYEMTHDICAGHIRGGSLPLPSADGTTGEVHLQHSPLLFLLLLLSDTWPQGVAYGQGSAVQR